MTKDSSQIIFISGVDGACFSDAAHALLTDMNRRLDAGELRDLVIIADDKDGNRIVAHPKGPAR